MSFIINRVMKTGYIVLNSSSSRRLHAKCALTSNIYDVFSAQTLVLCANWGCCAITQGTSDTEYPSQMLNKSQEHLRKVFLCQQLSNCSSSWPIVRIFSASFDTMKIISTLSSHAFLILQAGIHYSKYWIRLTITRQYMTAKPKLTSFIL